MELGTKTWSVNSKYDTQELALDAVSTLAVYEGVEEFIMDTTPRTKVIKGDVTEIMEPISPLIAVSHGAFTPMVQNAKGRTYITYNEYKSQVPLTTELPRKTIIEYVESMVYDNLARGLDLRVTYTPLRDGTHNGILSLSFSLLRPFSTSS